MDWMNVAVMAITALTPVLSFVAVWALKLAYSKIPAAWLFVAAPLAGTVVNYGLKWISGHTDSYNAVIAALLGLLAVVLREFITTVQTKGFLGPVSTTGKML